MKATPKLSYLSDIRPFKPEWWVQVKVIHIWKQQSDYGETMEIIFADKKVNYFYMLHFYNQSSITKSDINYITLTYKSLFSMI